MMSRERGNVLFLILIAVALFAALSYAVTKSTSGSGGAITEKDRLDASRITQWYGSMKTDYMRFSISSGVAYDDVRMTGGNGWTPCSAGSDCLWSADGGGVKYAQTDISDLMNAQPAGLVDGFDTGSSVTGITNAHFLFYYLSTTIDRDAVCQAYNDLLGLGAPGASQNSYPGEWTACFNHSSGNRAIYYVFHAD